MVKVILMVMVLMFVGCATPQPTQQSESMANCIEDESDNVIVPQGLSDYEYADYVIYEAAETCSKKEK